MGILQYAHLVALSKCELIALRSAMCGITQDAWRLTHPQIVAVSACRIRIYGISAVCLKKQNKPYLPSAHEVFGWICHASANSRWLIELITQRNLGPCLFLFVLKFKNELVIRFQKWGEKPIHFFLLILFWCAMRPSRMMLETHVLEIDVHKEEQDQGKYVYCFTPISTWINNHKVKT